MSRTGEHPADERGAHGERNRRTALTLVGWIVLLAVASVIVVWVRN